MPIYTEAQNVGIGTTGTPALGKLEVKGTVGAVSAMFYNTTTEVACFEKEF